MAISDGASHGAGNLVLTVLRCLGSREALRHRLAVVVAHPDDESIAAGASLRLMPGLLLVHVTDGAPVRLDDYRRSGFDSPAAYGVAREAELQAALAVAGVQPARARINVPDQDVALCIRDVAAELGRLLMQHGTEVVLTHAYEGGHPDHDATALAVHVAARRLGIAVVEFPAYHAGPDGGMAVQRFLSGPAETLVRLDPGEAARKRAMLDCFTTQAGILRLFDASLERFRPAPGHDFTAPPHPGPLTYESWGWEMTGARWRALAAAALDEAAACAG